MEMKCPKCNTKEIKILNYDYDEGEDCSLAEAECLGCHSNLNIYFQEELETICPECGYDCCSLGDPEDDLESRSVSYDAECDSCGEIFTATGELEIIKIKEVK